MYVVCMGIPAPPPPPSSCSPLGDGSAVFYANAKRSPTDDVPMISFSGGMTTRAGRPRRGRGRRPQRLASHLAGQHRRLFLRYDSELGCVCMIPPPPPRFIMDATDEAKGGGRGHLRRVLRG